MFKHSYWLDLIIQAFLLVDFIWALVSPTNTMVQLQFSSVRENTQRRVCVANYSFVEVHNMKQIKHPKVNAVDIVIRECETIETCNFQSFIVVINIVYRVLKVLLLLASKPFWMQTISFAGHLCWRCIMGDVVWSSTV